MSAYMPLGDTLTSSTDEVVRPDDVEAERSIATGVAFEVGDAAADDDAVTSHTAHAPSSPHVSRGHCAMAASPSLVRPVDDDDDDDVVFSPRLAQKSSDMHAALCPFFFHTSRPVGIPPPTASALGDSRPRAYSAAAAGLASACAAAALSFCALLMATRASSCAETASFIAAACCALSSRNRATSSSFSRWRSLSFPTASSRSVSLASSSADKLADFCLSSSTICCRALRSSSSCCVVCLEACSSASKNESCSLHFCRVSRASARDFCASAN
mmetsp:Transcript_2948/g.8034  ORF Transcript_2948/g.8034 Transcript_2948/m.8034 type:complete len:272 (-) Transcript_2948:301-1116(-)